jgi:TolB protein
MKPPKAAFPGKNGKIAFDTSRDGNLEIYAMSNVGTGEENLTSSSAGDRAPSYSPSGKSIAFVSSRDGNAEIYRMSSTGDLETNLTNNSASDSEPTWQPLH